MSDYLWKKYKGQYRVLAEFDQDTHDVPRIGDNIDPTYDDYYIPSAYNLKVVHGYRDVLGCILEGNGYNILRRIYLQEIKHIPITKESVQSTISKSINSICKELIDKEILLDVDIMDSELWFSFKAEKIDDLAEILRLKTRGAKIHPLSTKNSFKSDYTIPEEDLQQYQDLITGESKTDKLLSGRKIKNLTSDYLTKKDKTEAKRLGLNAKEYIHSIGKWDKYIAYLHKKLKIQQEVI